MIPAHAQCNNLECSICFRASVDSASASSEPGCEPSRSASAIPSPAGCSPSTGPVFPATTTCEPSPQLDLLPTESVPSMSSVEGSPARTSASPGKGPVLLASEADYGSSSPESLARFDRGTSSWRTSQLCLIEGTARFSETWPRSGMTRSGIAYRLPPLVRLTAGIESGSLAPTPTAGDSRASGSRNTATSKAHPGVSLTDWARGDGGKGRALLPTPRASEWKGTGPLGSKSHLHCVSRGYLNATMQELSGTTGRLAPPFVEWMMGFPHDWTALDSEHSATPSFRKSSRSSGKRS